jgi:hypothetical protein
MFDFLTAIPPEWIAIALFFLASMQGADGTSWLAKLVAKLTAYVAPNAQATPPADAAAAAGTGVRAGSITLQNIIALLIPIIPVVLPLIQGCGTPKTATTPVPAATITAPQGINQTSLWEDVGRATGTIVDLGSGGVIGAPVVLCSQLSDGQSEWTWADGVEESGRPNRRGLDGSNPGTGGVADGPGVSRLGQCGSGAAASSRCGSSPSGRQPVYAARPVASLRGGRWYPGKRIVGVARLVARPLLRLRLPGRPLARLFGRR